MPSNVTRVWEEPEGTCTLLPATFMVETGLGAACRDAQGLVAFGQLNTPGFGGDKLPRLLGTTVLPVFRSMEDWVFSIAGS